MKQSSKQSTKRAARGRGRKNLGLHDAYLALIVTNELIDLGLFKKQTVLNRRAQARKGNFPSIDLMREILSEVGWTLVTEESWAPPGAKERALARPSRHRKA